MLAATNRTYSDNLVDGGLNGSARQVPSAEIKRRSSSGQDSRNFGRSHRLIIGEDITTRRPVWPALYDPQGVVH